MTKHDEDRFRVKVAPPKGSARAPKSRFINKVLKQSSKAGAARSKAAKGSSSRPGSRLGRGHVAATLTARALHPQARRVVIKTRLVNLHKAAARSTQKHLRYIEREGVTREGTKGKLYGAWTDEADANEFLERSQGDRHQFRFIVSPEDAAQFQDLKAYTRDLMAQMERDLGTPLQWIAVDHWDTDNPHTHIVLRGKDAGGKDLIISPDYLAHGMRARASELATRWLGLRTNLEIRQGLAKEVTQERFTSLDQQIQREAREGLVTVASEPKDAPGRFRRSLLIGRLDHLNEMGLTTKVAPLTYQLAPNTEAVLRAMGERGDIIRTMQRTMGKTQREYALFDHNRSSSQVIGRVAGKGLANELYDRGYLVVDGLDGRAHYIQLAKDAELADFPIGGIVEVRGGTAERPADRTIAQLADAGVYRESRHLEFARQQQSPTRDPHTLVAAHVRRLEALRRAGIVERKEEGVWRTPKDLVARGQAYDAQRADGARVEMHSYHPIERQARAMGATWLDRQLIHGDGTVAPKGFGVQVRSALERRTAFLIEQGLARRQGQGVRFATNLLTILRARELDAAAKAIAAETGLAYRPVTEGQRVSGIYQRPITLTSGRFAQLADTNGFSLVPWRPVIEKRLGQPMSAIVRGEFISWEFGRRKDLAL